MKKLLSIVLALTLVLGMFPVFAAPEFAENTGAKNLKHYGFISGGTNGDLMEANKLTRQELAVILAQLHGKNDEAKVYATPSGFADEASFPAWAKGYISFAKKEGWLKGNDKNMFNNNDVVSDAELAVVIIRALGYPELNWGQHINFLNDKGISISGNQLSRADAFEAIWLAVSSPVAKDNKILGVELGKLDANLFEPQVKNLAINSVSANNLKEIIVAFNQPVDPDKLGKFTLKPFKKFEATVSEKDSSMVILTIDGKDGKLDDSKEYTLTIEGVVAKKDSSMKLDKTEAKFVVLDRERPEVKNVEFTGPKHVTITFSEPIHKGGKLVIKSDNSTLSANVAGAKGLGTNMITVPLFSALKDTATYSIEIKDFKDYTQNNTGNIPYSIDLTYNKDTEAPAAEVIKATQEYVIVRFSKPVTGLDKKLFHHSFTSYDPLSMKEFPNGKDEVKKTEMVQTVKLVFNQLNMITRKREGNGLPSGNVKFMINGANIKDLYGNKLGEFETSLTITADTEAPVVENVEVVEENQIKVTFSKEVYPVKSWLASIEVKDADGAKIIAGLPHYKPGTDKKELLIDIFAGYGGETVALTMKDLKDTTANENPLGKYAENIVITDKTAPAIVKATYKAGDFDPITEEAKTPGRLYVFFKENMSDSALEGKNYQVVNGETYTALTGSVSFFQGPKAVVVELDKKAEEKLILKTGAKIFVDNVTDVNGNVIKAKMTDITPYGDVDNFNIKKVTLVSETKAVVEFNQIIGGTNGEKISYDNHEVALVEGNGDKVIITLKDGDSFLTETDGTDGSVAARNIVFAKGALISSFDENQSNNASITINPKTANDLIKPRLVLVPVNNTKYPFNLDSTHSYDVVINKNKDKDNASKPGTNTLVMRFTRNIGSVNAALAVKAMIGDAQLKPGINDVTYTVIGNTVKIQFPTGYEGTVSVENGTSGYLTMSGNPKVGVQAFNISTIQTDYYSDFVTLGYETPKGKALGKSLVLKFEDDVYFMDSAEWKAVPNDKDLKDLFKVTNAKGTAVSISSAVYKAADRTITFAFDRAVADGAKLELKDGDSLIGDALKNTISGDIYTYKWATGVERIKTKGHDSNANVEVDITFKGAIGSDDGEAFEVADVKFAGNNAALPPTLDATKKILNVRLGITADAQYDNDAQVVFAKETIADENGVLNGEFKWKLKTKHAGADDYANDVWEAVAP